MMSDEIRSPLAGVPVGWWDATLSRLADSLLALLAFDMCEQVAIEHALHLGGGKSTIAWDIADQIAQRRIAWLTSCPAQSAGDAPGEDQARREEQTTNA